MSLPTFGASLLMAGGIINAVPFIAQKLSSLSEGKPILRIMIGFLSTAVGLALIAR